MSQLLSFTLETRCKLSATELKANERMLTFMFMHLKQVEHSQVVLLSDAQYLFCTTSIIVVLVKTLSGIKESDVINFIEETESTLGKWAPVSNCLGQICYSAHGPRKVVSESPSKFVPCYMPAKKSPLHRAYSRIDLEEDSDKEVQLFQIEVSRLGELVDSVEPIAKKIIMDDPDKLRIDGLTWDLDILNELGLLDEPMEKGGKMVSIKRLVPRLRKAVVTKLKLILE